MNEKLIFELAEKAGFVNMNGQRLEAFDVELLKFAQLFAEECASLFPMTYTDERYQRRIDKTIKKHFEA